MSIDLQGWYIKTSNNTTYQNARFKLPVIGANHSWGYKAIGYTDPVTKKFVATKVIHDGVGPQYGTADKTHTFFEQVELVIKNYGDEPELQDVIDNFRRKARELKDHSIIQGKPIISEWW
jgi:hypothetical protein